MHVLGAVTQVYGGIKPPISFVNIVSRIVENQQVVNLVLGAQTAFEREAPETVLQGDVGIDTAIPAAHILETKLIQNIFIRGVLSS